MPVRVAIKYKDGKKWEYVPIKELLGKSPISYIKESEVECIGALFEDDVPKLFISNRKETVEEYKQKGVSLSVDDMLLLMGTEIIPAQIIKAFPDATFETLVADEPKDERKWW